MEKQCVRAQWLERMLAIATPVLENLSAGRLSSVMPLDFHPERRHFAALEAFGRTLCGIAPWLELEGLTDGEAIKQAAYRDMVRQCLDMATDPVSPDYMNFCEHGRQPLVDGAFLACGLLRAPGQLVDRLPARVRNNVASALRLTRRITPSENNWVFFSAAVEAALYRLNQTDYDISRIEYAFDKFDAWYVGDGFYADGAAFHWDYYNSLVIHPFMTDILDTLGERLSRSDDWRETMRGRSVRCADVLERLIAPDGSYPVIGRSATYRFGAFQLLSQAAWRHFLPEHIKPAQVRCGLTAVIDRVCESDGMFDENGWLRPGVYGYQPELAEGYICIGSLYLCLSVFLALGLPPADTFWSAPDEAWSSKRLWSGAHVNADHAIHY